MMVGTTARPREDEAVCPAAVRLAGWQACVSPSTRPRQPTRMVACISCSETVCSLRQPRLAAASSAQLWVVLSSRSPWHLIKQAGLDGRRGPRVATTQTVPTWSRAAGVDLLSLFVCSRCMPTPVVGPCLSARERAGEHQAPALTQLEENQVRAVVDFSLRRAAICIKYTVGCFRSESVQSMDRDDVAICREIGGRDWNVV
jgi:hypothetical protein